MSNLKNLFPIEVLTEIQTVPSQKIYDISGIELGEAKYFYSLDKTSFYQLQEVDYLIETSGLQQSIEITNQTLLDNMKYIQIAVQLEDKSYTYEPQGEPDLSVLITAYNQLVISFQQLQKYNQNTLMICDTPSLTKVLPKLQNGEAWVYYSETNEFKGFPVIDLNDIANQEVVRIQAIMTAWTEDTLKPQFKSEMEVITNDYVMNVKIPQLDAYTGTKEEELQAFTNQKKIEIQDKFDETQLDHGVVLDGTDTQDLIQGRHWASDVNLLLNPPYTEAVGDEVGYFDVALSDGRKMVKWYNMNSGIQVMLEGTTAFSEWMDISNGVSDFIEVGYIGTGFRLAPVYFDDTWKLASTGTVTATGFAWNCDTTSGKVFLGGLIEIPTGSFDSNGDAFVEGEHYFLGALDGKLYRDKPTTGLFQPLCQIIKVNGILKMNVDIDSATDITPVVITGSGEQEVPTKQYVDGLTGTGVLTNGETDLTKGINKNTEQIEGLSNFAKQTSQDSTDYTDYTDTQIIGNIAFVSFSMDKQTSDTLSRVVELPSGYKFKDVGDFSFRHKMDGVRSKSSGFLSESGTINIATGQIGLTEGYFIAPVEKI